MVFLIVALVGYMMVGVVFSLFFVDIFHFLPKEKEKRATLLWPYYCLVVWSAVIKAMFESDKKNPNNPTQGTPPDSSDKSPD